MIKKINKIVKKYLRWINLWVVSKDKCINDIKKEKILLETSTIIRQDIPQSSTKMRRYDKV